MYDFEHDDDLPHELRERNVPLLGPVRRGGHPVAELFVGLGAMFAIGAVAGLIVALLS